MKRDCRERNARGLKILAYGVNKAADQYEVADGRTRAETTARADAPQRPAALATGNAPASTTRFPGRASGCR
jgi:hypothetical protein